jgi:hypothetical protein
VPRNRVGTGTVGDGLRPSPTKIEIHRSWTDEFGTLIAALEGRSGGRSVMVIADLENAENTLQVLQTMPSFKGSITLAIPEQLHAAPLEAVIKANQPNIVIALEPNCTGIATRGSAITTQPEQITSSTGMTYFEPGNYQAWTAGHLEPALTANLEHPSIAASIASSLKIPCAACDLTHLPKLLETLLV